MGNAVTVSIVLDGGGGEHLAGTNLTGRILVKVERKIKPSQIILVVKGKEKSSVRSGKQTKYAQRVFFQAKLILNDLNNRATSKVNPGSYSFPFSMKLSDSLPSSFNYGGVGPNSCSIQYKCVASVGNATTHQAFSVVSTPLQDVRVPCFLQPKTQAITSMGVISKGSITFGVGVDDTHIGKGQELVLSVALRNDTTVDIQHVCVKVVQLVTWNVGSGPWNGTRKAELVGMTELSLPGLVRRRKSKEAVQQDKLAGRETLRQSHQQIYEELSSGRSSIRIRIPQSASDTYQGSLLSVSHYIKLYLKTPPLVADIEEKIPLRVGNPPQVQQATRVNVPSSMPASAPTPNAPVAIPFATAIPVPTNTIEAPVATAPPEAIVLGGIATMYDSSNLMSSSTDIADIVPIPPPPQVPSLALLLEEMTASVNDIHIISSKLQSDDWQPIISSLSPADYGAIIAHVNMDFDQPRVAAMLAPHVNGGDCFTCVYCLSAIQNAAQWNRTAMVQKLLPLCVDVRTGFTMLQEELSAWEQTVTARDFQVALDHSDR